MKIFRKTLEAIIWSIASTYFITIVLLHLSPVQSHIGSVLGNAIAHKLGTKATIGRVDLGLLNRFIIDDVNIYDQKNKLMLRAGRVSAKVDIIPLLSGQIRISSAQLFGMKANLYKETAESQPNFQFALDSLVSKDTTQHTPLDLRIHSLIIRNGAISYALNYKKARPRLFIKSGVSIKDVSAHININCLADDSIDVNIRKLSFHDASGIKVNNLTFHFIADSTHATLNNFELEMPNTKLVASDIKAKYAIDEEGLIRPSLYIEGKVEHSTITPSDFQAIEPKLKAFQDTITLTTTFSATSTSFTISDIQLKSANNNLVFVANGSVSVLDKIRWESTISKLQVSASKIEKIVNNFGTSLHLPTILTRLGDISYKGFVGGYDKDVTMDGTLSTDAGIASINVGKSGNNIQGEFSTNELNLAQLLDNNKFGKLTAKINFNGKLPDKGKPTIIADGFIDRFDYNNYSFRDIDLDGSYINGVLSGDLDINDDNLALNVKGSYNTDKSNQGTDFNAYIHHVKPSIFGISTTTVGYSLDSIDIHATANGKSKTIELSAPFIEAKLSGDYDYATIGQSVINVIKNKLPTLPGLPRYQHCNNNFTLQAEIESTKWLKELFGTNINASQPIKLLLENNDHTSNTNLLVSAPEVELFGINLRNTSVDISTDKDTMRATMRTLTDANSSNSYTIQSEAAGNRLLTNISIYNKDVMKSIHGNIKTKTRFFKDANGASAIHTTFLPSDIHIGDTAWTIQPSDIVYSPNHIIVDHFIFEHGDQSLTINGIASKSAADVIDINFNRLNVSYILGLVNFDAVSFSGYATGHGELSSLFATTPTAHAKLNVTDFKFANGNMGDLDAQVNWNAKEEQIDINAIAYDKPKRKTIINGYISPKRNYMDIDIAAHNTRAEFLKTFCGNFLDHIDLNCNGELHVVGDLSKDLNLVGQMKANGKVGVKPLGTIYNINGADISFVPHKFIFHNDTVYDRNANIAIVNGELNHRNLGHLTYNIDVNATDFLSYDMPSTVGSTFYGTVYGTGNCNIDGKSGELNINVKAKPEKNTVIVYNVAGLNSVVEQNDFINWRDRDSIENITITRHVNDNDDAEVDIPTDIRLNFAINATQDAMLKLIMDNLTGDYIGLNGNGALKASYYNKGAFNIYGNYIVDHGIYKLSIQNAIKKDFQFQPGGTIAFGGAPFASAINLQAQYTVQGVSLSDLNMGSSFSNNTIRVNCLMNIAGTASQPRVTFNLDMPTVQTEAKQMILNLMNSEEQLNQQVLYLLAVGRFYNQGANNAGIEGNQQQSQTSVVMQSLLSGTITQQINNILSSVVNSSNWNIGANITTGTEGWNNAEYEGLLSGRMLNNRLLFNGQFGYRDNANATSSFIGDFDLRYLLLPNGNISVNMYNKTNDRYFTRNSLNTQGIGLIMKKDFTTLSDFFGFMK